MNASKRTSKAIGSNSGSKRRIKKICGAKGSKPSGT
jgi:hypothetical protein